MFQFLFLKQGCILGVSVVSSAKKLDKPARKNVQNQTGKKWILPASVKQIKCSNQLRKKRCSKVSSRAIFGRNLLVHIRVDASLFLPLQYQDYVDENLRQRDIFLPQSGKEKIRFCCGSLPRQEQCKTIYTVQRCCMFCATLPRTLSLEKNY